METEEGVGTVPVEGSWVAGSGRDTLLYTCSHFCELQSHQEGEVIENISRMKAGQQESFLSCDEINNCCFLETQTIY